MYGSFTVLFVFAIILQYLELVFGLDIAFSMQLFFKTSLNTWY